MPKNRTWITREEIAEIHEARADKAQENAMNGGGKFDVKHVVDNLNEEDRLRKQAANIRATEKLASPVGSRVA
jgi:hypothetical protein